MSTVARSAGASREKIPYAVCALAAVLLLSSCGSDGDGSAGASPTGSSSSTPSPSTPSPSTPGSGSPTPPTPSPSMPDSGRARPATMTGTVTGIEGGCTVFTADGDRRQWVLVGEAKAAVSGTAYTVSGVAIDTMDPNCPQGLPFQVASMTPMRTGGSLELTGVLEAGVETGCRVLRTDTGTFVLNGPVAPADGTRVTVTGQRTDNIVSHCQQGDVIDVQSVTPVK